MSMNLTSFKPPKQNDQYMTKRRKISTSSENSSTLDNSSRLSDGFKNYFGDMKISSDSEQNSQDYINIPQKPTPEQTTENKTYKYLQNIILNKKNMTSLDDFSDKNQPINQINFNNFNPNQNQKNNSDTNNENNQNIQNTPEQSSDLKTPNFPMFSPSFVPGNHFSMMVQSMYGMPFNMQNFTLPTQKLQQNDDNDDKKESKDDQKMDEENAQPNLFNFKFPNFTNLTPDQQQQNDKSNENDVEKDQTKDENKNNNENTQDTNKFSNMNFNSLENYSNMLAQNFSMFSDNNNSATQQQFLSKNSSLASSLSNSFASFSANLNQSQTKEKMIGKLTESERKEKVEKYLEKKKNRKWKNIRYTIRQNLADNRQRSQGRFIKSNNPRFNVNIYDKNVVKSINKQLEKNNNIMDNLSCPPQIFKEQQQQQ